MQAHTLQSADALARRLHCHLRMKPTTLFAALVVLFSSAALAETLGLVLPAAVSLEETREVLIEQSDVRISAHRIDAKHGVKRVGTDEFLPASPVVLGATYMLKDAIGDEHLLHIRNVIDGQMFIDLKPLHGVEASRRVAHPGRFKVKSFVVNGSAIEVVYPDLVLQPDGTFKMGRSQGKYAQAQQGLSLDGHYAEWGRASVNDGGKQMTFEFYRGTGHVKAVFERIPEDGSSVTASR